MAISESRHPHAISRLLDAVHPFGLGLEDVASDVVRTRSGQVKPRRRIPASFVADAPALANTAPGERVYFRLDREGTPTARIWNPAGRFGPGWGLWKRLLAGYHALESYDVRHEDVETYRGKVRAAVQAVHPDLDVSLNVGQSRMPGFVPLHGVAVFSKGPEGRKLIAAFHAARTHVRDEESALRRERRPKGLAKLLSAPFDKD